ncbi:MAG: Zinc-ribbon protein [Candidatus Thermoplasmatota archaeon]|nr:Zinc-ribbon protein [Candidatus Thermoplasmatota archaeon]
MGSPEQPSSRMCVQCGKSIAMDANVCQYCGKDYRVQPAPVKKQTVMPLIGGILVIIAALTEIYSGLVVAFWGDTMNSLMPVDLGFDTLTLICGLVFIILALIALIGGIFAIQRKKWSLAIVGAVFSLLGGYFILPLVGLILIAVSKSEFD